VQLARIVARRLDTVMPGLDLTARAKTLEAPEPGIIQVPGAARIPYFCSGCPHNTSTRLPEGSRALAGIGCHFMANWMDRETEGLIQMGGEGANWIPARASAAGSTSSRISATAPTTTPVRWRSARRSRQKPTSPTRYCSTTPSP
jgi:TPP-dependent indolepyruvate ferredoxin oxidoreductase alpha subunit